MSDEPKQPNVVTYLCCARLSVHLKRVEELPGDSGIEIRIGIDRLDANAGYVVKMFNPYNEAEEVILEAKTGEHAEAVHIAQALAGAAVLAMRLHDRPELRIAPEQPIITGTVH